MKLFIEKIQNIDLFHNDKDKTPLAIAYDFSTFPTNLDLDISIKLFNIQADKEYVIVVKYIASNAPSTLHLLNNVTLTVHNEDMIKVEKNYGLALGSFLTTIPIEEPAEFEIEFELRSIENIETILDTYKTYLVIGAKK